MENAPAGSSKKSTIYVGGFAPDVREQHLLDTFVTFGDILEINMPTEPNEPSKHKGYAFLTFSSPADAQEAIDNYDLNELPGYAGQGNFLKCSIAQPNRFQNEGQGNKFDRPVWESEEWLREHAKPLDESGGETRQAVEVEGEEAEDA